MTKGKPATATAADGGVGAALVTTAPIDELAGLGDGVEFADDGLGEVSGEDVKIAAKVFNMVGVGANGRALPKDAYYDTIDESCKDTISAAFLHLHKSNLYSKFDNGDNRTHIVCRSYDRTTGTIVENFNGVGLDAGATRPCKGCPDAQWTTDNNGKRNRNCSPVYNMFGVDRDVQLPFVVRFKKTSLSIIKSYLQKHHIGRRVVRGQRLNYPLFCFGVTMRCKMSDDGKYALPVLERGDVLSLEEIKSLEDNARTLRESVLPLLNSVEAQAEAREGGGGDTSFDPSTFAADEGKDFVA